MCLTFMLLQHALCAVPCCAALCSWEDVLEPEGDFVLLCAPAKGAVIRRASETKERPQQEVCFRVSAHACSYGRATLQESELSGLHGFMGAGAHAQGEVRHECSGHGAFAAAHVQGQQVSQ